MITHIRMKNFKSWEDSGEVKLAPLTGFFGTNSSGKSSLLQMLLLLKQTVDSDEFIFFGDENSLVNLGSFREAIHRHHLQSYLGFELACKFTYPHSAYEIPEDGSPWKRTIDRFAFDSMIQIKNGKLITKKLMYGYDPKGVAEIVCEEGAAFFPNQPEHRYALELKNCYGELLSWSNEVAKSLREFSSAFEELFFHVYYLGPARVHSKRRYQWEGRHPRHIRQWGDQTVEALLSARVRKLKTFHEEAEIPIEERVSYWLQEMELAHSFLLDWTSQGSTEYEVRIQKTSSSPPVTLVDMGYGLGQFLPVLVLCYYAPEGSTLILEQPGIHLHPKVQSQLADLLIEVVTERRLQILIESHSEHLLTRLQRRIAEEKISVDQTALYFCRNDEGVSTIERLDVDESGNIKNWPDNFFGEVMGDMFAMTDAQTERMTKQDMED